MTSPSDSPGRHSSSGSTRSRRSFLRAAGLLVAGALVPRQGASEETRDGVLYPRKLPEEPGKFSWYEAAVSKLPVLKHDRGSRWPLITWEGFSSEPQAPEYYHRLLERGLTQHIRLDAKMIDTALAIQRAGSPVIVMEGASGVFPANLAGEPPAWAHQFDDGYKPKEYARPCPSIHVGWARFADSLRETLRRFQEKGVRIDAVWTDWENDPLYGADRFEQAQHCKRCREILPRKVMVSSERFMDYTARKFYELFGAYYAAPVLEHYPACSVTNWLAQPSTPDDPQPGWSGNRGRIHMPPLVTAWNPTAYGAASWVWKDRARDDRRDQEHVDQVYTNLLLRQVSLTGKLRDRWAPEKESIPWVTRWVSEAPELEFPVMSRERYREVLRHLWLRGVSAMQVFNPRVRGYEEMSFPEVEDAAAVYDEMLLHREFLESGEVLTYDCPREQDDGAFGSGLRLGDRAVLRVFKQGGGLMPWKIRPWHGKDFELEATPAGATYVVEKEGRVEKLAPFAR